MPDYDTRGMYHEGMDPSDCEEPTQQDIELANAFQEQSATWAQQGRCMGCGAEPHQTIATGYCINCMEDICG